MVRECRPPAREPARSSLARRSTMATSTRANASSPANISPVGPPPAITTMLRHHPALAATPSLLYKLEVAAAVQRELLSTAPLIAFIPLLALVAAGCLPGGNA